MELGTLIGDAKGKGSRATTRGRNTDALIRLGPLHSSVEGPVMGLERRERLSQLGFGQPATGRASRTRWKAGVLSCGGRAGRCESIISGSVRGSG
jgi:hypothetical protein